MGKASSRKNISKLLSNHANEGTIMVSFVFDAKKYVNKHQLTASEMKHMKELCVEYGDLAADQMLWKVAMRGTGMVAENIMAKAALDYIKKYYKGPAIIGDSNEPSIEKTESTGEIVETLARASILESEYSTDERTAQSDSEKSQEN